MPQFTITPPYNGISQDSTYGDDGQCLWMENIAIDDMGYESLSPTLIETSSLGLADTINHMLETPAGVISCGASRVFLAGGDKSAVIAGASRVEYVLDSSGVQFNYFFNNTNVRKTDATITTVLDTDAHVVGGTVTATCVVYKTIIYAIGSVLYKYDPSAGGIPTMVNDKLETGVTVRNLHFYNDILVATCSKGLETIIYQLQFDGTNYTIYSTEVREYTLGNAIGSGNIVYWTADGNRIMAFSGGYSQELRYIGLTKVGPTTFGSLPSLAIKGEKLLIGNGTTIWIYGSPYAGRKKSLTILKTPRSIQQITANFVHAQQTTNYLYSYSSKYPDSGYSISLPYRGPGFGIEKGNLKFKVGYSLTTGTSIVIAVNTEKTGSNYIDVVTISDTTKYEQVIDVTEIQQALITAGYNPDFHEIRFEKNLIGGSGVSGLRDNTPFLYEIIAIHENINYDI